MDDEYLTQCVVGKAQESDASWHWNKRTAIRQELDQFEG